MDHGSEERHFFKVDDQGRKRHGQSFLLCDEGGNENNQISMRR